MPFHTTPDSYTKLLMHADEDNGSIAFTDSSDSPHTITRDASVDHDTGNKVFGSSGIYIPKANRLQIADSTDWQFGTGDFTIDLWAKYWSTTDTAGLFTYFLNASNRYHLTNYSNLEFYCNRAGSSQNLSFTNTRDLHWHHYAVVLHETNLRIYVDGTKRGENTSFTQDIDFTGGTFYIGTRTDDGSDFTTYSNIISIDEFRVSKGIARWTDDFTPPSQPYSKIDDDYHRDEEKHRSVEIYPDQLDSYTSLLIHSDTVNDAYMMLDSSDTGHEISRYGHTQHRVGQKRFGKSSIFFDGTTDYLVVQPSGATGMNFGTSAFTIDCWVYPTDATGAKQCLAAKHLNDGNCWVWGIDGNDIEMYYRTGYGGYTQVFTGAHGMSSNNWYHLALVRVSSTSWITFVDGVSKATSSTNVDLTSSHSSTFVIGYTDNEWGGAGNDYYTGYIDEYRVTKGLARWTTTFKPSNRPYGTSGIENTLNTLANYGGKVGIGTTDPAYALDVNSHARIGGTKTNLHTVLHINAQTSGYEPYIKWEVGGSQKWQMRNEYSANVLEIRDAGSNNGVTLAQDAGSWGTFSDSRTKNNIVPISDALSKVNAIKGVTFNFNNDTRVAVTDDLYEKDDNGDYILDKPDPKRVRVDNNEFITQTDIDSGVLTKSPYFDINKKRVGVIAQDLIGEMDEAVEQYRIAQEEDVSSGSAENVGDRIELSKFSVKYTEIIPFLIESIKELTQAHRDLRAQITGSTDLNQLKSTVSGSTFV